MRKIGLAAIMALGVTLGTASADDTWAGTWMGQGKDNRGDQFQMALIIHPDGSTKLSYQGVLDGRSYQCTGQLLPISAQRNVRVYREAMSEGNCIDAATVRLTRAGATLRFAWAGDEDGTPVNATGALRRK